MENAILIVSIFLLFVTGITTLVIVARLYKMHDVRNSDGQYSWMVPGSWSEIMQNLTETQKLMAGNLAELSIHNEKISKLLGAQTDATLLMYQELKAMCGEKPNNGKTA